MTANIKQPSSRVRVLPWPCLRIAMLLAILACVTLGACAQRIETQVLGQYDIAIGGSNR